MTPACKHYIDYDIRRGVSDDNIGQIYPDADGRDEEVEGLTLSNTGKNIERKDKDDANTQNVNMNTTKQWRHLVAHIATRDNGWLGGNSGHGECDPAGWI